MQLELKMNVSETKAGASENEYILKNQDSYALSRVSNFKLHIKK